MSNRHGREAESETVALALRVYRWRNPRSRALYQFKIIRNGGTPTSLRMLFLRLDSLDLR